MEAAVAELVLVVIIGLYNEKDKRPLAIVCWSVGAALRREGLRPETGKKQLATSDKT